MADQGHGATDTAQHMLDRAYDAAIVSGNYTGVDAFIGGTGSGKSVTSEATPLSAERRANRIIVELHAENAETFAAKVDKAREAGLPVDVHVVIRDPVESYKSVVGRYARAETRQPGSGKAVPVNYGAATHEAVIENVPKLIDWYGDDPSVNWHFIDNRGTPEAAREVSAEDGLRLLSSLDTNDLASKFNDVLDNAKLTRRDRERFEEQSLPSEFGSGFEESNQASTAERQAAGYGDKNVVFTKDRLARAQEAVRSKLNPDRLNAGIDPTVLPHLLFIAGYHLEAGSIKFADWSTRMVNDLGYWVTPHLEELYRRALENIYWRSRRPELTSEEAETLRDVLATARGESVAPLEDFDVDPDRGGLYASTRPHLINEGPAADLVSERGISGAPRGNTDIMVGSVGQEAPGILESSKVPKAAAGKAGSPTHRAARWEQYQDRGGTWDYERWSNVYEQNMGRATRANKDVDAYHRSLGWGSREVPLDVDGLTRRLDIADKASFRGREVKTGYQTATKENLWEIQRDQALRKGGWDIQWHFTGRASRQLLEALRRAGIPYTGGTQ
jgi:hypothetical protein